MNIRARWQEVCTCMALLAGVACSTQRGYPPPVEERTVGRPSRAITPVAPSTAPLAGSENAGKPGYHTVRSGDTLIRIGLDSGQNWRDLARWNKLDNPNVVEVGQVLRLFPPDAMAASDAVVVRPVPIPSSVTVLPAATVKPLGAGGGAAVQPSPVAPVVPFASTNETESLAFMWPANGQVLSGFDESKNKGLDLGGKPGDPVYAAADGKVVYAGAGLRGYGNLVIIKHNNTFLTAYAHSQSLLVKEDQAVKRGQTIAEMGNSESDQVKLHFEIRRLGKPVDPVKLLPAR